MPSTFLIRELEKRLQLPLPGKPAQYKMAHEVRQCFKPPPTDAKTACVLVLLYPKSADWHIVLIQRKSGHPNDRHGGQIGFPGGRYEKADGKLVNGALREAEEEVGIHSEDVKVLGTLTELYISVSNFRVFPFVGCLHYTPVFSPQFSEVDAILEIPFAHLQHPDTVQKIDLKISENIILKNVPYFNIHEKVVWGATAMILSELLEVLKN
jgi:8-oxo-dGTP pyrophosphatase MutT (NUDIX family)